MLKNYAEKGTPYLYTVFRVLIGLLFLLHGLMKAPGILNGNTSVFSLMGLAGIIEVLGGILIILGLFTRLAAGISGIEMLVAYFKAHASGGLSPLVNKGEASVLFFAAFLVLIAYGAGKYSLDRIVCKEE